MSAPCAALWPPMLSPAPPLLSYSSSFESLQKRGVCKVFVAHFPGRRALAGERDGLGEDWPHRGRWVHRQMV